MSDDVPPRSVDDVARPHVHGRDRPVARPVIGELDQLPTGVAPVKGAEGVAVPICRGLRRLTWTVDDLEDLVDLDHCSCTGRVKAASAVGACEREELAVRQHGELVHLVGLELERGEELLERRAPGAD